jgi:hypothetical protein
LILVDTSIWIGHLRTGNRRLVALLERGQAMIHPFVIGELVLGGLATRGRSLVRQLPRATVASDDEVLAFIHRHALAGAGIGYVDAHLLAAARLTPGVDLWTRDRQLFHAAVRVGLAASMS